MGLYEKSVAIQGIKNELKALVGTDSEVFASYPNLFARAMTDNATEQTFSERVTAGGGTIKDTIAFVERLKGNARKFNQIIRNEGTATNLSVVKNGNTYTATYTIGSDAKNPTLAFAGSIVSGHKYVVSCRMVNNSTIPIRCYAPQGQTGASTSIPVGDTITDGLFTANSNNSKALQIDVTAGNRTEGAVVSYSITPQIFDLTAIYGAGNEPTSANAFANDMGYASVADMPYFAYDLGSIISVKADKIVSKAGNLCRISGTKTNTSGGVTWKVENDHFNISGTATGYSEFTFADLLGSIPFNSDLYISRIGTSDNVSLVIKVLDGNGASIGTITWLMATNPNRLVSKAEYPNGATISFSFKRNNNVATSGDFYIGVSENGYMTEYSPYFEPVELPTRIGTIQHEGSTMFPDGLLSAGNAYDEITPTQAIKRIGKRAYQSGDESDSSVITDGTNTLYVLATPITENTNEAKAFYKVSNNGKEIAHADTLSAPVKADIRYRD